MKPKFYFLMATFMVASILFFSCNMNEEVVLEEKTEKINEKGPVLIDEFAVALAKVFNESKEVRDLIKDEALKKINHDYDVLLILIKDKELENGVTMESKLNQYLPEENLSSLLKEYPTLTIFVPSLPENSFSAEKWDTNVEIPQVAIRTYNNGVPVYNATGEKSILLYNEIPLFPIVVLKENERIKVDKKSTRSMGDDYKTRIKTNNGIEFVFIDEVFNNISSRNQKTRLGADQQIPSNMQKVFDSKPISDANNVWQRDYIYYDIDTITGRGTFKRSFGEHLYSFQLIGNPTSMYEKLWKYDNGGDDPQYNPTFGGRNRIPMWTDGDYEFKVKINVSSKTGLGSELIKYFFTTGSQLFVLDYYFPPRGSGTGFVTGIESTKKYILEEPLYLFSWNLEDFGTMIKISIEEEDPGTVKTESTKTTSTFATNFEFNASIGEEEKVGAKFGGSATHSQEVSLTITNTDSNDLLGDVYVSFGDDVITSADLINISNSSYFPNYQPVFNQNYSSGIYRIEITPLQTY